MVEFIETTTFIVAVIIFEQPLIDDFIEIFRQKSVRLELNGAKPGWIYRFIPSLNMQIAISDSTGVMYIEDKIKNSPRRAASLKNCRLPAKL